MTRISLLVGAAVALIYTPIHAQPAPSFVATCGELRAKTKTLDMREGHPLYTISVRGKLTMVKKTDPLVYLAMCEAPDIQVLCVTYETNNRVVGDETVITGSYYEYGQNHVLLDPCLHYPPE